MSIRSMTAEELKVGQSAEVMALVDEAKAVIAIKTVAAPDFNVVRVCVERLLETCRTLASSIPDERVKNQVLFRVGVRKTPSSPARGLFMRLNTCVDKTIEADQNLDTAKQASAAIPPSTVKPSSTAKRSSTVKQSKTEKPSSPEQQPSTDPPALPKGTLVELAQDQRGFAADDLAVVIAVVIEMSEAVFDAVRTRR